MKLSLTYNCEKSDKLRQEAKKEIQNLEITLRTWVPWVCFDRWRPLMQPFEVHEKDNQNNCNSQTKAIGVVPVNSATEIDSIDMFEK